ncbi:MAG: cell division protein PerM [Dermatophilaceae bacterium]
MSLLHRDRRVTATAMPANALTGGRLRWRSAAAGGSAAVVSMLTIVLPALLVWVASAESTVDWTRALSVGTSIWLLANGAPLGTGPATISLTPWLLAAIPLGAAIIAVRRVLVQLDDGSQRRLKARGGLRRNIADAGVCFVASYATVGLLVALATSSHPLHASLPGSVLGTAVVGGLAVLVALALEFRGDIGSVAPDLSRLLKARLPVNLRRAIRPGLGGAFAVFGAGLVLTLGVVVAHRVRIGQLYDTLGGDPVGISVLSLGQLLALPNVALWAASWMAGPGFAFGQGTSITWSHSNPGLLPLIPGLGALPDPGPLPAGLWLVVLVPIAAGALVGWRAVRSVARLSSWQVKARVATAACVVAALTLTLASALAGGSLGAARLSVVGAPSLAFGVAVFGELLLGAMVVVCLSHLRAARR